MQSARHVTDVSTLSCAEFHAEELCRTSQSLKTRSERVKRLAEIAKTITYGYLSQITITLPASLGPLSSPKAFSSFPMFYKLVQRAILTRIVTKSQQNPLS